MFDKFKKRNDSASRNSNSDKDKITEDDFFKNDEKLVDEDEDSIETEEDTLADDLKPFTDDFQKTKKENNPASEDNVDITEAKKSPKNSLANNKKEDAEKWSMKRHNDNDDEGDWLNKDYEEGELAVDVYQDKDNIYVKSTIAGISVEDIDISLHNDMLTIRGKREKEKELRDMDYLYQECYWGSFSRSIILPIEVKVDKIDAYLRDGILTIVLPKVKTAKSSGSKIKVKEK